jgi:ribosome-interacting GTPase 1
LQSHGIHNAAVVLNEPIVSLQQVQDALDSSLVYKKALALVNFKGKTVELLFPGDWKALDFSFPSELERFKKDFFGLLGKVLVYTKKPGEEADLHSPLVLPEGSTVAELARTVHKELAERIQHARLFGENAKFKGQKVPLDYRLRNFDVIEIAV